MTLTVGGTMFALFCLLVVLKLLGYFMFSWWLVFAPLLAMILGLMIVVFTVLLFGSIAYFLKDR